MFRVFTIIFLFSAHLAAATLSYDSINRLIKADYGNGLVIQYSYDNNGNRTSRTVTDNGRTITITVPSGGGSVSGAGKKLVGDTATLQATPQSGSQFDYWKENGSIISYDNPLTFTVSVSRDLEAYFSTLGSYNGVMARYSLDPTTDGAPSADPDGDGMNNTLEFALGTDPSTPDTLSLVRSLTAILGEQYPTITFKRRKSLDGIDLSPKVYHSLRDTTALDTVEISATDNGDGTETVIVRSSEPLSSFPEQYFKIFATKP